MGNTEVKQFAQETALNKDEVTRIKKLYATYGSSLIIDKAVFASIFDTSKISFNTIDRVFAAFDKDGAGSIDMNTLAVAIVACERAPIEEKLQFLYDVLQENGEKRLPKKEFSKALATAIATNVERMRGNAGTWHDRECAACKRNPKSSFYSCVDCCSGYVMGVPLTVTLCPDCVAWEGIYEEPGCVTMHKKSHTLVQQGVYPKAEVYHPGVMCDSCGVNPILGSRFHCTDCKDLLELCQACHVEQVEPLAHVCSHSCVTLSDMPTLEDQVNFFMEDFLQGLPGAPETFILAKEFIEWGMDNELVNNILNGFEIQYVRLSPYEESVEYRVETYHQDSEAGKIELNEFS